MKKYFLPIFLVLFLFSCQNNQEDIQNIPLTPPAENIAPTETITEKTSSPNLTTLRVGFRDFFIPVHFEAFFANKNLNMPYASTTAIIVYIDQNGNEINNFENITQNTTAHIFADSYCYNGQDTTIHLQSSNCDHQQCEFPLYDNFSLEELMHNDLFNTLNKEPWKISGKNLFHPTSGNISPVFNAIQDCSPKK